MMEFITDNMMLMSFGLAISVILGYLGVRHGKNAQEWFKWANETAFFAWHSAEARGLLEGIKGADKFAHYLSIWKEAYEGKFGEEMNEKVLEFATKEAERLSKADKEIKAKVQALANPK